MEATRTVSKTKRSSRSGTKNCNLQACVFLSMSSLNCHVRDKVKVLEEIRTHSGRRHGHLEVQECGY